ncbi:MAG: O-antigen ligase family protein [Deltaproteobacteria bacterium]|nr:O-antigen ligase family protein [Deltaproteobacteria bacterium]MBF0525534.1 O-antigen ligase family protein [Deltaproteobacteria bacterium]
MMTSRHPVLWGTIALIGVTPLLIDPTSFDQFQLVKLVFVQVALLLMTGATLSLLVLKAGPIFSRAKDPGLFAVVGGWTWLRPVACLLLVAGLMVPGSSFVALSLSCWLNLALFLIGYGLIRVNLEAGDVVTVATAACLAGIITTSLALAQYWGENPFFQTADPASGAGRMVALMGNVNTVAAYLMVLVPLAVGLALTGPNLGLKMVGWTCLAGNLAALGCAQNLSALAGLTVSVGTLVWLAFFFDRKPPAVLILPLVLLVVMGILVMWRGQAPVLVKARALVRVVTSGRLDQRIAPRLVVGWPIAAGMIEDHPLVGLGPASFALKAYDYQAMNQVLGGRRRVSPSDPRWDYAHNEYLQLWSETGALGFLASCWLVCSIIREGLCGLRQAHKTGSKFQAIWLICLISALAGVLVNCLGFFYFHLAALAVLALTLAALIGVIRRDQMTAVRAG